MKWIATLTLLLLGLQSNDTIALGRLFMTPEQRVQLSQKAAPMQTTQVETLTRQIHVNGYVKPRNSANTLWINGSSLYSKQNRNYSVGTLILPENKIAVDLQGARAKLLPGQTIDIDSLEVSDSYAIEPQAEQPVNQEEKDTALENPTDNPQLTNVKVNIEDVKKSLKTLQLTNDLLQ